MIMTDRYVKLSRVVSNEWRGSRSTISKKTYGDFTAVDNVTIDIADGEFLVLLGPVRLRQDHDRCAWSPASSRRAPARSTSANATSPTCRPGSAIVGLVFQSYALLPAHDA